MRTWFLLVFVVAASCAATETGNPSLRPELDPTVVDGEVVADDPMLPAPPMVVIRGRPGSVDPPEGRVLGWGLQREAPTDVANVDDEGGFILYVVAAAGELVRLQIEAADRSRSTPLDVRVSSTEGLSVATPVNECVSIEPANMEVTLPSRAGTEATVLMRSRCTEPVEREAATLRTGSPALALIDEGPLAIPPGGTSEVRIRILDPAPEAEDIVLVSITSPQPELRAVTLLVD